MSVLVLVSSWLIVLTLCVAVLVRQVALMTARLSFAGSQFDIASDGPEVGSGLPEALANGAANALRSPATIIVLSADCAPCRTLAADLGEVDPEMNIVALVHGDGAGAEVLTQALSSSVTVLRDPEAGEIIESLNIHSQPFALAIRDDVIAGKRLLRGSADLRDFIKTSSMRDTEVPQLSRKELADVQ